MQNTISKLHNFSIILSLCILATLFLNHSAQCAILELSAVNIDDSPINGMVFQIFPGIVGVNDSIDFVRVGGQFWKESSGGYVTGKDGKISVNIQNGIYTVVGFSQESRLLLTQEVSVPGSFVLRAADAIPVNISCRAADNSPISGAEVFFRPTIRSKASLGYANNNGLINARVSPGKYHAVLRATAGKGPHYLILPDQTISNNPSQINFHVAELPTCEIRFDLPAGTAIAIFEVMESGYTIEYSEGVEPEIGYDAAYTDFYPIINTAIPYTISANINYNFNMSFAVLFGSGTIYAYELRPSVSFIQPGNMRIGVTEKDKFSFSIRTVPKGREPVYQPGDKVELYYQCENTKGDRFNRILNYSEARVVFPMTTVWDPNGVSIGNNFDADRFYEFSFDLPLSAAMGDYRAEISLDAGMYGKITGTFPFRVVTDSEPPQFSSVDIPETLEGGQDLTIIANITDNSNLAGNPIFRFSMDGGLKWTEITMNQVWVDFYQATILWNSLGIGKLNWQIIAEDLAGNKAEKSGIVNIVDTLSPIITHKPSETAELGVQLRIQAEIKDNVSVKEAIIVYGEDNKQISMSRSGNIYTGYIPGSDVTFAGVNYYIRAVDTAGNIANTGFIKIAVKDALPPIISHTPVVAGIFNTVIRVEAKITDNSRIINAELFYKGERDQDFKSIKMNNMGEFFLAEIPANSVTLGSLQYYIIATDGKDPDGNTRATRSPENGYYIVTIRSESYGILARLEIQPLHTQNNPMVISAGGNFKFKALGRNLEGEVMPVDLIWTVTGGIGNIDQDGFFNATGRIVGDGIGSVIATARNLSPDGDLIQDETWVRVSPGEPANIILNPSSVTIMSGISQRFFVKVMDAYFNVIDNYGVINWRVDSNDSIGTIKDGIFTSSKAGNGKVIANLGNIQAISDITIMPGQIQRVVISTSPQTITAGDTIKFTANGYDVSDNQIPIMPIWSIRGNIGAIQKDGLFRAGTAGNGEIVAAIGDVSTSINIKVVPGQLANITVSPFNTYLPISTTDNPSTQQFVADGWDIAGNPVPLKSVSWTTDAMAGTISSTGLFTAVSDPGIRIGEIVTNGTIWATGASANGIRIVKTSTVVIQKSPADRLTAINILVQGTSGESANISLATGQSLQFEAVGSDAKGRRISINPSWSVEGGIGEIDAGGLFTAMTTGSGVIIANAGGLTGKLSVQVTPGALKSIAIKPEMLILNPGSQSTITALGYNSYENVVPISNFRWTVNGDSVNIQPEGDKCLIIAQKPKKSGYSTITISSGDLVSFATIFVPYAEISINDDTFYDMPEIQYLTKVEPGVIDPKVDSLQQLTFNTEGLIIIPSQLSLVSGALQKLNAFVISDNRLIPVMPAWRIIGNIGKIDSTGNFLATYAGKGEVEAFIGSLTARRQINITSGKTEKIRLLPDKLSIKAGKQQNFYVIGRDSSGNITDSKPEFFVTGDIGTINQEGILTAKKTGSGSITGKVLSIISKADVEVIPESLMELKISPVEQTVTAGSLTKFNVFGKDAYGNLVSANPIWEIIGNPGIGSISSNGLFMAKKTGQCQIQARIGKIASIANIKVVTSAPAFVLVEPNLLSISSRNDAPIQFLHKIIDRFGNIPVSENVTISWEVTPGVGTINPQTGLFINKRNLNATRTGYVTATAIINEGTETERTIRGSVAVILLPTTKALASVTVTPNPAEAIKGDSRKFTATSKDADGVEVFVTPVWSVTSVDGSISIPNAISFDGIFKATPEMALGSSWKVTASITNSEGKLIKGEANIKLVAGLLQSIEVLCSDNSCAAPVKSGKIIELEAIGYDQFKNKATILPEWRVTEGIGTINVTASRDKATFAAGKAGQGEVIASSNGKEGRIHLTIQPGDIAGITIFTASAQADENIGNSESNPLIIKSGSEISFIVMGNDLKIDDLGKAKPVNSFPVNPVWALRKSEDTIDLGILTNNGKFTGRMSGNGRIEAKIDSITAIFHIRVITGDLKTIKISPYSVSIVSGMGNRQFSALGYDSYGNQIPNPGDIVWQATNNIGNIDKNGLFTPISLSPGGVSISGIIIASIGVIEGSASVTIVPSLGELTAIRITADSDIIPAGGQSVLTIKGVDENGHIMTEFPPSMEISVSAPEALGSVSFLQNNWIFQAQRVLPTEKTGLIIATAKIVDKTFTHSISIRLIPGLLSKIDIEPKSAIISAGEDEIFKAFGYDQWGNQLELESLRWSLSNSLGQLVQNPDNPQEVSFTANTMGQCKLIARFQNYEGQADLEISPGDLKTLTIEPETLTITAGSSYNFVSFGMDSYNNRIENLNLQWEIISDVNIGTITDDSVFSALKAGNGRLRAIYKSGNTVINSNEARISVISGHIVSAKIIIYKDDKKLEIPYLLLSGVQYNLSLMGVDQRGNESERLENVSWNIMGDTGAAISNGDYAILSTLFPGNIQISAKAGDIFSSEILDIAPHTHYINASTGGIIAGPFGSIMKISPGALKADETISVALSPSPNPPDGARRVSHVYSFKPDGKVFNFPVELSISYKEGLIISQEIDQERLYIYSYDKFNGKWLRVGGKKNQESITANVNYLSLFAIMEEYQDNEISEDKLRILDVQLSPNVYFAPEINRLNIRYKISLAKYQTVNVRLGIYDIKGRLVKQILEKIPKYPGWNTDQWDGIDESGKTVKNGRYFVLITAETDNDKVSIVKHLAVFR